MPAPTGCPVASSFSLLAPLEAQLEKATGRLWIQARRPELYRELAVPTGLERDVHQLKYEE